MNAANLCPEPTALINAANKLRLCYNDNVSQQIRMAKGLRVKQLEEVRRRLAEGVGLDPKNKEHAESIAMIRNASEGNNAISSGFRDWYKANDRRERDNVVLWVENHPTNLESWYLRSRWQSREGLFDIIEVSFDFNALDKDITRAFTDRIDHRTRFVSYSMISNSSGFRIPDKVIEGIWEHVKRNGYDCHIHIDGTMVWGARQVNLSNPYCHSFVSSAHKWFLGPKETALLWMSKDKVKNFAPNIFAYDYQITVGLWEKMPDSALRFELLGQRDDVNLIILGLTQLIWTALQDKERYPYKRVAQLSTYLIEELANSQPQWELITPSESDRRWGVVRIAAPQENRSKTLYDWLYDTKEYRIAGSGDDKTFRLCPHIYNTAQDIKLAVRGMNAWRNNNH